MFKDAATVSKHTDMEEYAPSECAFIQKCTEDVCVTKNINTRANQNPWMNSKVYGMLKAQIAAFKTALGSARANLKRAIRVVKQAHAQKILGFFHDPTNTRQMGQGIQSITESEKAPFPCDDNTYF